MPAAQNGDLNALGLALYELVDLNMIAMIAITNINCLALYELVDLNVNVWNHPVYELVDLNLF